MSRRDRRNWRDKVKVDDSKADAGPAFQPTTLPVPRTELVSEPSRVEAGDKNELVDILNKPGSVEGKYLDKRVSEIDPGLSRDMRGQLASDKEMEIVNSSVNAATTRRVIELVIRSRLGVEVGKKVVFDNFVQIERRHWPSSNLTLIKLGSGDTTLGRSIAIVEELPKLERNGSWSNEEGYVREWAIRVASEWKLTEPFLFCDLRTSHVGDTLCRRVVEGLDLATIGDYLEWLNSSALGDRAERERELETMRRMISQAPVMIKSAEGSQFDTGRFFDGLVRAAILLEVNNIYREKLRPSQMRIDAMRRKLVPGYRVKEIEPQYLMKSMYYEDVLTDEARLFYTNFVRDIPNYIFTEVEVVLGAIRWSSSSISVLADQLNTAIGADVFKKTDVGRITARVNASAVQRFMNSIVILSLFRNGGRIEYVAPSDSVDAADILAVFVLLLFTSPDQWTEEGALNMGRVLVAAATTIPWSFIRGRNPNDLIVQAVGRWNLVLGARMPIYLVDSAMDPFGQSVPNQYAVPFCLDISGTQSQGAIDLIGEICRLQFQPAYSQNLRTLLPQLLSFISNNVESMAQKLIPFISVLSGSMPSEWLEAPKVMQLATSNILSGVLLVSDLQAPNVEEWQAEIFKLNAALSGSIRSLAPAASHVESINAMIGLSTPEKMERINAFVGELLSTDDFKLFTAVLSYGRVDGLVAMKKLLRDMTARARTIGDMNSTYNKVIAVVERHLRRELVRLGVTRRILIVPERLNDGAPYMGLTRHYFKDDMSMFPEVNYEDMASLPPEQVERILQSGFVMRGLFTYTPVVSADFNDRPKVNLKWENQLLTVDLVSVPLIMDESISVNKRIDALLNRGYFAYVDFPTNVKPLKDFMSNLVEAQFGNEQLILDNNTNIVERLSMS